MAPILVIGIGNPGRGDDALGPLLIEALQDAQLPGVELLTDFQLQVEFALDLQGRSQVIFADASVAAPAPFTFTATVAERDASYSSHALSPGAVLHACRHIFGEPPPAWTLAIRGYRFGLGQALSPDAAANLAAARAWLVPYLSGERGPLPANDHPGAALDGPGNSPCRGAAASSPER